MSECPAPPEDFAEMLNAQRDGWNTAMAVRFVRATVDEVVAEFTVGPQHRQPYGIVHGGVYSGIIETLASVGAALFALRDGLNVVGLENHTSFLRAVREGTLRAVALPLSRGRKSHVWEGRITDERERLVASGTVRLMCLVPETMVAGGTVKAPPSLLKQSPNK